MSYTKHTNETFNLTSALPLNFCRPMAAQEHTTVIDRFNAFITVTLEVCSQYGLGE